jgi:ATP-dependent Clp protease protease subunit
MTWIKRKLSSEDEKNTSIVLSTESLLNNNGHVGNKVYLYDDISRSSILTVSKEIDEVTRQLKMFQLLYGLKESPTIELHISSDGGDISPALSMVDKIKNNIIPIDTYCEGIVASAGTLISVSGRRRFLTKNSCLLLHQLSGEFWGPYESINDEKQNLDLYMTMIKNIYLKHTKIKAKDLVELLKHDLCLTSDQCIDWGIVDEII